MRTYYHACYGCGSTIWGRPFKVTDAPIFKYWHQTCWLEHARGSRAEPAASGKDRVGKA